MNVKRWLPCYLKDICKSKFSYICGHFCIFLLNLHQETEAEPFRRHLRLTFRLSPFFPQQLLFLKVLRLDVTESSARGSGFERLNWERGWWRMSQFLRLFSVAALPLYRAAGARVRPSGLTAWRRFAASVSCVPAFPNERMSVQFDTLLFFVSVEGKFHCSSCSVSAECLLERELNVANGAAEAQVSVTWLWNFLSERLSDLWQPGGGPRDPAGSRPVVLV